MTDKRPIRAASEGDFDRAAERVLVTGFPAFTAKRFIRKLLKEDERAQVFVLTRDKFSNDAADMIRALPAAQAKRADLVVGDVCDMDMGLSGREYRTLAEELTTIHHLAGIYYMGVDKATAKRVNIDGTRGVIELAREANQLRRLCHWSTAAVSGRRKGVVLEEELDEGQGFNNFYEETKFAAEKLAREAMRRLPITVLRPGLIVGDSVSGEVDKFDGPYYLMVLIATNALNVRVPLPGRGSAPLHLVPIDYVIEAAYALSIDERAAGKTFHLTDPNPFAARKVYELVAEHSQGKLARSFVPAGIARTLLRTPGLDRLARAPMSFFESFDRQCFYNSRLTQEFLGQRGIHCPTFDTYVEALVRYVREVHSKKQREADDDVFDPFD